MNRAALACTLTLAVLSLAGCRTARPDSCTPCTEDGRPCVLDQGECRPVEPPTNDPRNSSTMKLERVQTSPVHFHHDPYGQIAAFLEGERVGATVRVSDLPMEIARVSCEEMSLRLAERGHNVEVTTDDPSRTPESFLLKLL